MTEFVVCDAYNMARELFDDKEIEPCFDQAAREVRGFWLCDECAWALETFTEMSKQVVKKNRDGIFTRLYGGFVAVMRMVKRMFQRSDGDIPSSSELKKWMDP